MNKVAELREAAIAAWRSVDEFYQSHVKDGELSAEDTTTLDGLNSEAKAADEAYARAAAAAGQATTARERIDTYSAPITGQPVNWAKVAAGTPGVSGRRQSLGEQFVHSEVYQGLRKSNVLGSDRARIGQTSMFQAVANTDVLQTGTGGPLESMLRPTYIPDVLPLEPAPRNLRNLFSQDTAPDAEIKDVRQTTRSGVATAVGQATAVGGASGTKPQVSAGWEPFSSFPITVAAWAATTRQALASESRTRSLIDNELGIQVAIGEADEIVNGDGSPGHLDGLDHQDVQTLNAAAYFSGLDADANLAAIRHAKTMVRRSAGLGGAGIPSDALAVNPNDSEQLDLLQDGFGRYRAGDPFSGSSDDASPVWRLPRVEDEAIEEGIAWVGAFKLGGTVYDVQPIQIYVSDSHEDFFIRNLIAILGEERIALVIRRPKAFVKITLADWVTGS